LAGASGSLSFALVFSAGPPPSQCFPAKVPAHSAPPAQPRIPALFGRSPRLFSFLTLITFPPYSFQSPPSEVSPKVSPPGHKPASFPFYLSFFLMRHHPFFFSFCNQPKLVFRPASTNRRLSKLSCGPSLSSEHPELSRNVCTI